MGYGYAGKTTAALLIFILTLGGALCADMDCALRPPILLTKAPMRENEAIRFVEKDSDAAMDEFSTDNCKVVEYDTSALLKEAPLSAFLWGCLGVIIIGENKGMWHVHYFSYAFPMREEARIEQFDLTAEPIAELFHEEQLTAVAIRPFITYSIAGVKRVESYLRKRSDNLKWVDNLELPDYLSPRYKNRVQILVKVEENGNVLARFFSDSYEHYIGTMHFYDNEWHWVEIDIKALKRGFFKADFIEKMLPAASYSETASRSIPWMRSRI